MVENFQNLIKNIKIPSIKNKGINVLSAESDNPLGIYGLYTYPVNFFIFDTSSSAYQEGYEIVRNKANFILFLKNINDDPNTILSISNTGEEGTWEQITGFKKVEEVCPEYFLLIPDLESIKDYIYSAPINFHDWKKGYFKISYFSDRISQQFNIAPEDDTSLLFSCKIYDTEGDSLAISSKNFSYRRESLSSLSSIKMQGVPEKDINNIIKISKDKIDWEVVEGFGKTDTDLSEVIPPEFKNLYEFVGYIPKNFELSEYISNISFHDWGKAYIQCEYAKTEDNPEGITKELTIIPATSIQWESYEPLSADKLNFIENKIQEQSSIFGSNYSPKTWNNNEIINLDAINYLENSVQQLGFNYIKQTWNENDEITADKLNHLVNGLSFKIRDEIVKDGITSVCVYIAESKQDWGQYIFADKSHDLDFYIRGYDQVDSGDVNDITTTPYAEWGGRGIATNITSLEIGDGLENTNSLITMNLQPQRENYPVLWDWVEQFRSSHSNDWFVPTANEAPQVYNQKSYLENLSNFSNWTSSETDEDMAMLVYSLGGSAWSSKNNPQRSRLCFYL